MSRLAAAHDAAVQMIETSMVRVHQHAACIADSASQSVGRSRGGLTSKLFNKIKHYRRVATRYDKLAANYLAFVQLASIRLWLSALYEFTP